MFFPEIVKSSHQQDSRRSYQCIKFLVSLSNKLAPAKEYLMQSHSNWQWAVNWLKRKVRNSLDIVYFNVFYIHIYLSIY